MKTVWIASLAAAMSSVALAQTTIYKLVDESGRVTYSNKPMKGAIVLELEPITTIPATPGGVLSIPAKATPAVAKQAALPPSSIASMTTIEPRVQKQRDDERRKILSAELTREEQALTDARKALHDEQRNPTLVAAVRVAQQADNPSPAELIEFRKNIDKASGRIRGLQSTVAEHEKNIEAIKKELGALKP